LDALVKGTTSDQILSPQEAAQLQDVDCILVLGCGVHDDGSPSDMLHDRLRRGVELYELGAAPKLLMSGDHGRKGYDEVDAMKSFAVEAGIPSEDVFMDHAGFSTYESLYRAKEIFGAEKLIVVSQEYHLYRALYIAERMGLEAYGVSADYRTYWGQTSREIREILARAKDFANTIFWPEPTFLGEAIPVSGNGDLTNDTEKE
jgi:vancomycin permeability regulator SanA